MKKFLLASVAAICMLGSCANYRQITLDDVKLGGVKMTALTAADVKLELHVTNPTKATFEIIGTEGTIYRNGSEFARISQVNAGKTLIAPGTPSVASITLRAKLTDPFSALSGGFDPKSWKLEKFRADATVWVKKGKMTKKFDIKNMPLKELIEKLQ